MQAGLVVFAQPAVAHCLDVLGQTVVPGADLHVLGVAHHGDVLLGADGERPCHGSVVLHAVAVLGDELHTGRQVLQVVDALAVKVLGDGNGLVHVAQTHLGGLLLHHEGLRCRRADRLCVGHQVYKGVAAGGSGAAAGLNVLFVLKARGAPVAVQIHERGQDCQPSGIDDRLIFSGQCFQLLTHSGDLAVLYKDLKRSSFGVHSVYKQHRSPLLIVYGLQRFSGLRAKKNFSPQREKFSSQKKGNNESTAKAAANCFFSLMHIAQHCMVLSPSSGFILFVLF